MTYENDDLAAVYETVSARLAGTDESLARSWTAITASQPEPPRMPPRRRMTVGRLVPMGAAATVTAVALGTVTLLGGGEGTDPATPPDIPLITDDSQIAFPLDEYDYTTEGYVNYMDALEYLADECLRRFGLDIPERGPVGLATNLPEFDQQHARLYGVFDREVAATWGYHAPPGWGVVRPDASARSTDDPGSDYHFLLGGRTRPEFADRELPEDRNGDPLPEDGCLGEAKRILSGGLPEPDFTVVNNNSQPRAWADPRVQAAEAAWSDCMRGNGYHYDSLSDVYEQDWTGQISDVEIATAVADVECKIETNLVGVLVGVTSEYQRDFIESHREELQPLKQWLEAVSENSARLIADAGTADD